MIKDEYRGRFLKRGTPLESSTNAMDFFHWIEVDDEVAKDKVGHSFRTTPKKRTVSGSTNQDASWQSDAEDDYPGQQHSSEVVLTAPSNKRVKTTVGASADNSTDGSTGSQDFEDSDLELLDSMP